MRQRRALHLRRAADPALFDRQGALPEGRPPPRRAGPAQVQVCSWRHARGGRLARSEAADRRGQGGRREAIRVCVEHGRDAARQLPQLDRQERRGRLWRRHTALEAEGGAVPHLLGPRVYHYPPRWTRRQASRRARAHRRRRRRAARPSLPTGASRRRGARVLRRPHRARRRQPEPRPGQPPRGRRRRHRLAGQPLRLPRRQVVRLLDGAGRPTLYLCHGVMARLGIQRCMGEQAHIRTHAHMHSSSRNKVSLACGAVVFYAAPSPLCACFSAFASRCSRVPSLLSWWARAELGPYLSGRHQAYCTAQPPFMCL
mmetsp:Transcript_10136/g.29996  ORF Transcript_10136/g.29996 Transcript_10136/m.29996 type:complete len:314 (-) Transcript_10136:81-1022(-)